MALPTLVRINDEGQWRINAQQSDCNDFYTNIAIRIDWSMALALYAVNVGRTSQASPTFTRPVLFFLVVFAVAALLDRCQIESLKLKACVGIVAGSAVQDQTKQTILLCQVNSPWCANSSAADPGTTVDTHHGVVTTYVPSGSSVLHDAAGYKKGRYRTGAETGGRKSEHLQ